MGENLNPTAFDVIRNPNKVLIRDVLINGFSITSVSDTKLSDKTTLSQDSRFSRYIGMNLLNSVNVAWGSGTDFSIQIEAIDPYNWLMDAFLYSVPFGKSNCTIELGWYIVVNGMRRKVSKIFRGLLLLIDSTPLVTGMRYRLTYQYVPGLKKKTINADSWFKLYSYTTSLTNTAVQSETNIRMKVWEAPWDFQATRKIGGFQYIQFPFKLRVKRNKDIEKSTITFNGSQGALEHPKEIICLYPFADFFNKNSSIPQAYFADLLYQDPKNTRPFRREDIDLILDGAGYWSLSYYLYYKFKNPPNHWFFYALSTESLPQFYWMESATAGARPFYTLPANVDGTDVLSGSSWDEVKTFFNGIKNKSNNNLVQGRHLAIEIIYPEEIAQNYVANNNDDLSRTITATSNHIVISSSTLTHLPKFTIADILRPFSYYYKIDIQISRDLASLHDILRTYELLMSNKVSNELFADRKITSTSPYAEIVEAYNSEPPDYNKVNKLFDEVLSVFGEQEKEFDFPFVAETREIAMKKFFTKETDTLTQTNIPGQLIEFKTGVFPTNLMRTEGLPSYRRQLERNERLRCLVVGLPHSLATIDKDGNIRCGDPIVLPENSSNNYVSGLSYIVDFIKSAIKYHMVGATTADTDLDDYKIDNDFNVKVTSSATNKPIVLIQRAQGAIQQTLDVKRFQVRRSYITNRDFGNVVISFRLLDTRMLIHGFGSPILRELGIDSSNKDITEDLYELEKVLTADRAVPAGDNKTEMGEVTTKEERKKSKLTDSPITSEGILLNDNFRQAMLKNYRMPGFIGELALVGDPDIEPFEYIGIKVMRHDNTVHFLSGIYQVMEVEHDLRGGAFQTTLSLFRHFSTIGSLELSGMTEFESKMDDSAVADKKVTKTVDVPGGDLNAKIDARKQANAVQDALNQFKNLGKTPEE